MTTVTERLGTLSNIDLQKLEREAADAKEREVATACSDVANGLKAAEDARNGLAAQISGCRSDIATLDAEKSELRGKRGASIADGDGQGIAQIDARLKRIGVEIERAEDHIVALLDRHGRAVKSLLLAQWNFRREFAAALSGAFTEADAEVVETRARYAFSAGLAQLLRIKRDFHNEGARKAYEAILAHKAEHPRLYNEDN